MLVTDRRAWQIAAPFPIAPPVSRGLVTVLFLVHSGASGSTSQSRDSCREVGISQRGPCPLSAHNVATDPPPVLDSGAGLQAMPHRVRGREGSHAPPTRSRVRKGVVAALQARWSETLLGDRLACLGPTEITGGKALDEVVAEQVQGFDRDRRTVAGRAVNDGGAVVGNFV